MDWLKIISAVVIVYMMYRIYPAVKQSMQNPEKADSQTWMKAIIPLAAVVLFVFILIKLV